MSVMSGDSLQRILIVDDNPSIHEDITKVLAVEEIDSSLDTLERELFGAVATTTRTASAFEIASAHQGHEGLALLRQALEEGAPFSLAIVDMRMPPGWDGMETIKRLWRADCRLQVIICTAYSDHSWEKIVAELDPQDRLLIIRKPFDNIELRQAVYTLTRKWQLQRQLEQAHEARYRFLYDDNPTTLMTIDREGSIVSVNRFGARQLGYSVEELIGQPASSIYASEHWATSWNKIQECFRDHETINEWEVCKLRKDGSRLWVRQTARAIEHPTDGITLLSVSEDITKVRDLHERLSYEATHDSLTGLLNRRAFDQRLKQSLERLTADGTGHVLCYIDLDQFKLINDTRGHLAGDELLRRLAEVLRQHFRRTDTFARLGGDEFGVIMEGCSLERGVDTMETLRRAIADLTFRWKNGDNFSTSASIGVVAVTDPRIDINTLLSNVDTACYIAKEGGRNRVHVHTLEDRAVTARHEDMQAAMRINKALEHHRFRLFHQPIVPCRPTRNDGLRYEILIRMEDERGAVIRPGAFLPAAERYNLATKIDSWVIRNYFGWLLARPDHLAQLTLCSINLSGQSLCDKGFLRFLTEHLDAHPGIAGKICFEVTETAAIANLTQVGRFIDVLSRRGCSFALDDFGTGLSSFAYLKNLPVDVIKIDGMFVRNAITESIDLVLVKSIIEIGRAFGKRTVAECVENQELFDQLKVLGVDYVQGYHTGRPRPLTVFDNVQAPGGRSDDG